MESVALADRHRVSKSIAGVRLEPHQVQAWETLEPTGISERPRVEIEPLGGRLDDGELLVVPDEEVTKALTPGSASGVVVNDGDYREIEVLGARREVRSDALIRCLRPEHRGGCAASLRGCEGVGDPFAHDENAGSGRADGTGPREARVGAERGGGVVVLRSVTGHTAAMPFP